MDIFIMCITNAHCNTIRQRHNNEDILQRNFENYLITALQ